MINEILFYPQEFYVEEEYTLEDIKLMEEAYNGAECEVDDVFVEDEQELPF